MSTKLKLSLLQFFQFVVWGAWYVTGGTYMLQTLHFSGTQVGLIYGTLAIAGLVSPFLMGLLADRYFSTEKLLALLHFFGALLLIGLFFTRGFILFYILMLFYSFMYVPTTNLSSSLTLHNIKDRTKDFAAIRVWGTVGWILVGFMISALKWETKAYPFLFAGLVSLVFALFCLFLPKTPPTLNQSKSFSALLGKEGKSLLANRAFLVFIIGITLIRIPASFYYSFVNPFLFEIGVANPAGKMALGQVTEILLMVTFPFALKRFGLKPLFIFGTFAWGFRYLLFGYANADALLWMVYFGIFLHGATYNYTTLAGQIYIDQIVPKHLKGSAQGFITFITMGLGPLIGVYLAGTVVEYHTLSPQEHNWQAIFWFPAAVGILTSIGFALTFKTK